MVDDVTVHRQGRLQRASSSFSGHINSFIQVLYRHGLVMGIVAVALYCFSPEKGVALPYITALQTNLQRYLFAALLIIVFFFFYSRFRAIDDYPVQGFWFVYLFYISVVEELAFRLLLPNLLSISMHCSVAVILSNAIFAGFHYFTLRWRMVNCIFAFFGGLGLSRLLNTTEDLAIIVLLHWLVTFINTPTHPGGR